MAQATESEAGTRPLGRKTVYLHESDAETYLSLTGFSAREPEGRWSDAPSAQVVLQLPAEAGPDVILKLGISAFVWRKALPRQDVMVCVNGAPAARWVIDDRMARVRPLFVDRAAMADRRTITIDFQIPTCMAPSALGINQDGRPLGLMLHSVGWEAVVEKPGPDALIWQLARPVGPEARKTFDRKIETGFWSRFVGGPNVLDIGFRGDAADRTVVPILEGAIGVDLDYPGYDGRTLPFADGSQDAVYSSHCLEHIPAHINAIQEWHRVTKLGGHIITAVPHAHLYERRRRPPSRWNGDHQRCYTSATLLAEFEAALAPNSYRVRYLEENDLGYSYTSDPNSHAQGCYEITLVVEKIALPSWRVED